MGTHDYTTEACNGNFQVLEGCRYRFEGLELPSSISSYPKSEFFEEHLFEIISFNSVIGNLGSICSQIDLAYQSVRNEVVKSDVDSAAKMADPISDLVTLTNTLNNITSVMSGTNTGGHILDFTQCIATVNKLTYDGILDVGQPDFENMSAEDVKYYYEYYISIPNDQLTDEDRQQIDQYLKHLKSGCGIDDNMTEFNKERVKMFNELYEKLYPDQAARVNAARAEYENQRGSEVLTETKYEIYSEYLDSGNVSDDLIKHQIETASKYPKGLYRRVCAAQDDERYLGTKQYLGMTGSVDEIDSNSYYRQGTTSVYNVQSHKNDDGSVDISFSAANSTKRYTEITVYDSEGNIQSRDYLKGQQDPSSIFEVFGEAGKMGKDIVSGKVFSVDSESFNSKNSYSYTIPKGGYIQITEDPNEMNRGAYKQQIINSMSTKAVDVTLDLVKTDTGNAVVDFGVDIAKSLMAKTVKNQLNGTSTSLNDYGEEIVSTATDSTIDAIATAGEGNPAGLGILGIKTILNWNSGIEENVRDIQQNKSKGNSSLYIYN